MPRSFRDFVMSVANWRAGSIGTSSILVSTKSLFLSSSAQANLVSQTLLIASLMPIGGCLLHLGNALSQLSESGGVSV